MRLPTRPAQRTARLNVETLEDRLTPVNGFALTGVGAGTAALLAFDTAAPTVTTSTTITGISGTDTLVGMDFRPQNGHLYALGVSGTTGTLYDISYRTGTATAVGAVGGITAGVNLTTASGYGFDFNPTNDRIRVVFGSANFRIDPNTGTFVASDTNLNGGTTVLDGSAYTNNFPNATTTVLYGIDSVSDKLYTQVPATGVTTVVGTGLGVDFAAGNGFDIVTSGTDSAFAALTVSGVTKLYSVNLTTGVATAVGNIGTGAAITGFALHGDLGGVPAIELANNTLIRFNTSTPGTATTSAAITGVTAGESLVGIDFRPATGQLFGLGVNAVANTATLYRIDPQTAVATAIGTAGQIAFVTAAAAPVDLPPQNASSGYGFDFNPTADRVRVTTTTGLNFRVNPITGAPVDGDLGGAAGSVTGVNTDGAINGGGSTGVDAAAYTNSFGGATVTTLYTIDTIGGLLFIQNPPNGGTQTQSVAITLNGTALPFVTSANGFDIPGGVQVFSSNAPATGLGYFTANDNGTGATSVYSINLATGAAVRLGAGPGSPADGFAVGDQPTPFAVPTAGTVSFGTTALTVVESVGNATLTLTRTGGTLATTVTVTAAGGTINPATPGTDFTAGPYTVTFAAGQTTATLNIPITNDTRPEPRESIALTITSVTGGTAGTAPATVFITDDDSANAVAVVLGAGTTVAAYTTTLNEAFKPVFPAFPNQTTTGLRVAKGDVNGDGFPDVMVATTLQLPTPTGLLIPISVALQLYDGKTGAALGVPSVSPGSLGGINRVSIALGDVNGDGFADIILGGDSTVIALSGKDFSSLGAFTPFGAGFTGGVNVATGDINKDGRADIIMGQATFGSLVMGISGADGASLGSFDAGNGGAGVTLAVFDFNQDGTLDFLVGTTLGAGVVKGFNGKNLQSLGSLNVFAGLTQGVNIGIGDQNQDGIPDLILGTATGAGFIEAYSGADLARFGNRLPFGASGGVFIG